MLQSNKPVTIYFRYSTKPYWNGTTKAEIIFSENIFSAQGYRNNFSITAGTNIEWGSDFSIGTFIPTQDMEFTITLNCTEIGVDPSNNYLDRGTCITDILLIQR